MISKNREAIFKEFLCTDAILDLIIFLIYLISQIFPVLKIFEYVITAKIIQVLRIIQSIFQRYDQEFKYTTLSKIIILIVILLTFLHTQAAIFVRIGLNQLNKEENWIEKLEPVDLSSYNIYIHSIYWSIMTMATVGYGDIHPVSQIEIIYVSIVSLISCGIYGYGLNQIGQIVNEIQKKNEDHNKQMQILNSLMSQRQIDKCLQNQVRQYFEYLYKEEQLNDDTAIQLIQLLPYAMKNNILFDMNHKLLYNQKLFSLNFSKEFLNKLSLELKIMNLGPDIEIFNKGNVDERLYFITKGRVDISIHLNSKQKTCFVLEKGDMLGELEFFTREIRNASAKTVGVVSVTYLDFKDFFRCLQQFQNDLEKYYAIKDKANMYGNISDIGTKCKGCKKFSHSFLNCPSLNVVTNNAKILKESQKSQDQLRDNCFKRFIRKKFNAFYQFEQNKKGFTQIGYYDDVTDDIRENSVSLPQTQQLAGSSLYAFQKQQSFNFKSYKNSEDTNSRIQQIEADLNSQKNLPPDSPQLIHQKRPTIIESTELSKKMPQLFRGQSKKSSLSQQKSITDQKKAIKTQILQPNSIQEDPRTPTNATQKRKLLFDLTQKDSSSNPSQQQLMVYQNINQSLINTSSMYSFNQQVPQFNQNNQQLHSPIQQKYTIQNMQTIPVNRSIIFFNSDLENHLDLNNDSSQGQQAAQDETMKINGDLSVVYELMVGYTQNNIRYYVNQEYFDSFKVYKNYFPHNNITSVLKTYNNRFLKFKNSQKFHRKGKKQTSFQ